MSEKLRPVLAVASIMAIGVGSGFNNAETGIDALALLLLGLGSYTFGYLISGTDGGEQ